MLSYSPLIVLETDLVDLDRRFDNCLNVSLVNWIVCPFVDRDPQKKNVNID